jgi:hypothetical protein
MSQLEVSIRRLWKTHGSGYEVTVEVDFNGSRMEIEVRTPSDDATTAIEHARKHLRDLGAAMSDSLAARDSLK